MNSESQNLSLILTEYNNCQVFLSSIIPLENSKFFHAQVLCYSLICLISTIGFLCNVLVTYVLGLKTKRTPLTVLLIGLAISDIFLCLHQILAMALPFFLLAFPRPEHFAADVFSENFKF